MLGQLFVRNKGSPKAAAPEADDVRSLRAQTRARSGEVCDCHMSTAVGWPLDSEFDGLVLERSKSFVFPSMPFIVQNQAEGPLA